MLSQHLSLVMRKSSTPGKARILTIIFFVCQLFLNFRLNFRTEKFCKTTFCSLLRHRECRLTNLDKDFFCDQLLQLIL